MMKNNKTKLLKRVQFVCFEEKVKGKKSETYFFP